MAERILSTNITAGSQSELDMRINELIKRGYEVTYVGETKPQLSKSVVYHSDGTQYEIDSFRRELFKAKMRKTIEV